MVRPNPALSFWDRLLPHYRARDWDRCIHELRPVLDADEDALGPRLLCAGLHLAAAKPVLALLHYETLLPLAVGQGEFFAAIAVQKRLDLLHPASVTHARRYEVLRRWFISLGRDRRVLPGERPGELTEAGLLCLDPEAFTRLLEECDVEGIDPAPRVIQEGLDSSRVVLYGRAAWSFDMGDGVTLLEGIAEAGQAISVDPGLGSGARLVLTAELPTEMLLFSADALAALSANGAAPNGAVAGGPSASSGMAVAPRSAADPAAPPPPAHTEGADVRPRPISAVTRPRPDPRFEPFVATGAPVDRRRESRIAINLASGVARLGLVDTRVAPLPGHLRQLGPDFLELIFARDDLRHLRTRLEGSCLALQFNLGPDEPQLLCTGRVRYTTAMGSGIDASDLTIELEILPLRASERDRMAEAVRRFAVGGQGGQATRVA
ncbi:MAG: hypothetical protein ABIS67_06165 [Candidatus Eisenbacteria bacterium]